MTTTLQPKIYHIVHIDRLTSIVKNRKLWCDATMVGRSELGTTIGMSAIKSRRLNELTLNSHPGLKVGACVPFYFCPRSIMLYLIHQANHKELSYKEGQEPIIHLEADLYNSTEWAMKNNKHWAFTLSNAGAYYFEDRSELSLLNEIDWDAVRATDWVNCKEGKQAEFLMEEEFPWSLVERIGVYSQRIYQQVVDVLSKCSHQPIVDIKKEWYY